MGYSYVYGEPIMAYFNDAFLGYIDVLPDGKYLAQGAVYENTFLAAEALRGRKIVDLLDKIATQKLKLDYLTRGM